MKRREREVRGGSAVEAVKRESELEGGKAGGYGGGSKG